MPSLIETTKNSADVMATLAYQCHSGLHMIAKLRWNMPRWSNEEEQELDRAIAAVKLVINTCTNTQAAADAAAREYQHV